MLVSAAYVEKPHIQSELRSYSFILGHTSCASGEGCASILTVDVHQELCLTVNNTTRVGCHENE